MWDPQIFLLVIPAVGLWDKFCEKYNFLWPEKKIGDVNFKWEYFENCNFKNFWPDSYFESLISRKFHCNFEFSLKKTGRDKRTPKPLSLDPPQQLSSFFAPHFSHFRPAGNRKYSGSKTIFFTPHLSHFTLAVALITPN